MGVHVTKANKKTDLVIAILYLFDELELNQQKHERVNRRSFVENTDTGTSKVGNLSGTSRISTTLYQKVQHSLQPTMPKSSHP